MLYSSILLSVIAGASTVAARQAVSEIAKDIIPGAYIFEFKDGSSTNSFASALGNDGTKRLDLNYELFKGVSVQLNDVKTAKEKADKLAKLPEIKAVYPVQRVPRPNPKIEWVAGDGQARIGNAPISARADGAPEKDTWAPHVMTQVDKLRAKGYRGKGIKIAVVDTGIDYTHPALGNGCYGKPDCLVAFGTDFVGDAYDGANTPQPDNDPMDCGGHGSHVAGIIAAQNNTFGFTGAAPDVTLGAYKVFGCDGPVSNDILIAAFNRAYEDGVDIITSSIGGPSGWSEDAWAVAASRIVEKGVPVTISAGNAGDQGLFYASTASGGLRVSSIASFDNNETPTLYYFAKYDINGGKEVEFRHVMGDPTNWDGVNLPLIALSKDMTDPAEACTALPDDTPDLKGKIVLIRRGSCTFVQKSTNLAAKGAEYIMFYNNLPTGASGSSGAGVPGIKATSMVEASTAKTWFDALNAGKTVTLHMRGLEGTKNIVTYNNNTKTGGALSGYTSWGPNFEMQLKPQYGAPGGNILSTYPVKKGSYAVLSGTSMSCPLTAAITALIAEVRGTFDPELIENALAANANPQLFNDGTKFYDKLAPIPQQGSGLVQADDAAFATTLLSPSGLSFNDTAHMAKFLKFKLQNTGSKAITYKISHVPALTMYTLEPNNPYPKTFPNTAIDSYASLEFSRSELIVHPGQTKSVTVFPTPPQGLDLKRLGLWSGYVAINGTDGTSLSLPYQGLSGSLNDAIVLPPDGTFIVDSQDADLNPVPANQTFVIPAPGNAGPDDHLPALIIALAMGSRLVTAHLVPMTTCPPKSTFQFKGHKTIGQLAGFPAIYSPRGGAKYVFDGQLADGNYAPPGKYKVVVRALRIFGDEENEHDWDVSTSPAFKIKYE